MKPIYRTDLGRVVFKEIEVYRDRMLKILYDIACSPANDGTIGAQLDTIYLGMVGLGLRLDATKRVLEDLIRKKWIVKTARNEYKLTDTGIQRVQS